MSDQPSPDLCARLACLERRVESLWRVVDVLVGDALKDVRQGLTTDDLKQMRAAAMRAMVETASKLRSAAS